MAYKIHKAVVIGAGTMGAAIAAHLANAGLPVTLLDIIPDKLLPEEEQKGLTLQDKAVRNRIVQQGLERAVKSRPASFFTPEHASRVKTGNLEDDFDVIAQADWVIEAIVENLEIKRKLMRRVDAVRSPQGIVTTNTSGIPVGSIAEGLSEGFRGHFFGTHFFNPPRYLKLLEIIPTLDTLPEAVKTVCRFAERRLGKGIVMAKDTPNFIANRFGFGTGAFALDYILEHGYTVEEVDAITGPAVGHPKTATFRLIDLVGVDVWEHVGRNLAPAIPHDHMAQPYLNSERANGLIGKMVEKGWLGNKTKQGFYKEVRQPDGAREFWSLNLQTLEYEAPSKPRFESIGKVKDMEALGEKLNVLLRADDRAGELVRALTFQGLAYASHCIPEIADTPLPIDDAMRWGFGHEKGPFETWDILGVSRLLPEMEAHGFPVAEWVREMVASGYDCFYQYAGERKIMIYNPLVKTYQPVERPASVIVLKEQKDAGKLLSRNTSAALVDLGDGVACLEFNTKMNILDEDVLRLLEEAVGLLEEGKLEGLVIGNDAETFSAGFNLFLIAMSAQGAMWDELDRALQLFQGLNMRIRYCPRPVVVAPAGICIAGGAEIMMHASRVVAAAETYTGLVEVGMGLIPAAGGTKELMRRILNPPMRTANSEPLPYLQRVFEQIGMAKVATSAEEARQMGLLSSADRVVFNRDQLLAEAKREALVMLEGGYQPPLPEKIYAAGRDALAAMKVGIFTYQAGGGITPYESVIGGKLAYVLTGGELSRPAWVDEQYILDLEREAFISLCGEAKTQERIWHFLQTNKPLRN